MWEWGLCELLPGAWSGVVLPFCMFFWSLALEDNEFGVVGEGQANIITPCPERKDVYAKATIYQ